MEFSKNPFFGNNKATINNNVTSYSMDGGRRSLEEVRNSQINVERSIHPEFGHDFESKMPDVQIQKENQTGNFNPNSNLINTYKSFQNNKF